MAICSRHHLTTNACPVKNKEKCQTASSHAPQQPCLSQSQRYTAREQRHTPCIQHIHMQRLQHWLLVCAADDSTLISQHCTSGSAASVLHLHGDTSSNCLSLRWSQSGKKSEITLQNQTLTQASRILVPKLDIHIYIYLASAL